MCYDEGVEDLDLSLLLTLLPPNVGAIVLLVVKVLSALIGVLTVVLPLFERLAKLTKTERDDQALTVVQKVLSILPRVQIPAISQRPPAPAKLEVIKWPSPPPPSRAQDVSRAVVLPPRDETPKG